MIPIGFSTTVASMGLLAHIIFIILLSSAYAAKKKSVKFEVKPGAGNLSTQVKLQKYHCKFMYSAQGGTHEEWTMKLEILEGGSGVICTAERMAVSYLFFHSFKLELAGPMVSVTGTDVKSSQHANTYLGQEEYNLENNVVYSVKGKFKNHIEKVSLFSPIPHEEL